MKIRKLGSWIVAFLLFAVTPAALFGQNVYGKISGVVSDTRAPRLADAPSR